MNAKSGDQTTAKYVAASNLERVQKYKLQIYLLHPSRK